MILKTNMKLTNFFKEKIEKVFGAKLQQKYEGSFSTLMENLTCFRIDFFH